MQSLHATLEAETLALAQIRREAPQRAAQDFRDEFEREMKLLDDDDDVGDNGQVIKDEKGGSGVEDKRLGEDVVEGMAAPLNLDDFRLERQQEVERTWDEGLRELVRLKGVSALCSLVVAFNC